MLLKALTSAIYNNIVGGLKGIGSNFPFSMEQIEDEIIEERLSLIKQYSLKNLLPKKDLMLSIRCLTLDCKDIERCCISTGDEDKIKHFEVPQLILDFGADAIEYIGPLDGHRSYKIYTTNGWQHHLKRQHGANKTYVWVDTAPNANGMLDCYIFNLPILMDHITITAIFKDPRQLAAYTCCNSEEFSNITFLEKDIKERLTERYLRYFRQTAPTPTPNDLTVKP